MRQTNQQPLRLDLGQSPQQKLAEATYVFNLSEHRFHDRLPQVVERATLGAFQFVPHLLLHTGTRRSGSVRAPRSGSRWFGGTCRLTPRTASWVSAATLNSWVSAATLK